MKKTILATMLTSLFAATAAQSATVHDSDGLKLDVFGDIEVQYINDIDEEDGAIIHLDDADFGVEAGYDIGHGLTALGVISFTGADNQTADLDDAYVGLSSVDYGTLTVGKQVTIYDDAGIGNDFAFGLQSFYEQEDNGEQVIKYTLDKGNVYGGIAYLLNQDGQDDDFSVVDGKIGVRFGGADLTAFYGIEDNDGVKSKSLNLEARYKFGGVTLAAAYGSIDSDTVGDADNYSLAGIYDLGAYQFSAGWGISDADALDDKVNYYYVNTSYWFNHNAGVYAELGGNDDDDTELGYVVGMVVEF